MHGKYSLEPRSCDVISVDDEMNSDDEMNKTSTVILGDLWNI